MSVRDIPASSFQSTSPESPQSAGLADRGLASVSGPLLALITASICFVLAALSLRLMVKPENVTPIWPVNALVIALMARVNRRRWHWILIGHALACFAADWAASIPLASTCCYVLGDVLEALLATLVLTRFGKDTVDFSSLRHFFRLVIAVVPVNALTAAMVAGANFYFAKAPHFLGFMQLWAFTDGLAMLVVIPALLSFRTPVRGQVPTTFVVEASVFVTAVVLVSFGLFWGQMAAGIIFYHRPLVALFPFFIFAALRTNVFTISLMDMIFAGSAIVGTLMGRGPFVGAEPTAQLSIVVLQFSLMARTVGGLIIAIVMEENRRALKEVSREHERFAALAAATFEGIVIHEGGRIIDCNEQSARMFGYDRNEFIGMPIEPIIPPEDRQRVMANIRAGRDSNIQHGVIRKDGSRITAEARGRHTSYSGRQVRITAIRDITDRIRMEELAIQSEKMLSIGGLAAGLAHEINNPLAIMMQNAEVVLHRIRADSPANQAAAARAGTTIEAVLAFMQDREIFDMLSAIHKSGERAASIIRNMLAFSRARSSTMGSHRLDELLEQAIELAHSDFELKKKWELGRIDVVREFDSKLGPVACYASEIQQVLFNLLKNAVQAFALNEQAAAPPRIVVRTRREKDHARIDVEDNGPGMPESVRRRVFEPLFTTKAPAKGRALGCSCPISSSPNTTKVRCR